MAEQNDNFTEINEASRSQYILDEFANPHPRFKGLMQSIRERRGEKVQILIPLYQDTNTNMTLPTVQEPYPGRIYMDAMGFGMGCSCL